MGVTMKLKGLSEVGPGRWEYRRLVPASVKAVIGKRERKEVFSARSDAEILREYARVVAKIEAEIAAAKKPKPMLTPRAAWEAALQEADDLASGVIGADDPSEARELVAESLVSLGRGSPTLIQALMDPRRSPPALTVDDAREVYVKERLGGGQTAEHRPAMVRLERVMKLAAEAGLPATTALAALTREHARKVRDHMLSRLRTGGEGERVSPASVKRELGLLRTMITYGSRELGLLELVNPFDKLPIEGASVATGARVSAREKVDPLPPKIAAAMRSKLTGDLRLIWRLLDGTGCRLGEVTGLRLEDVILDGEAPHVRIEWHEGRHLKTLSRVFPPFLTGCIRRTHAAIFSFCAGVMPPMPMFGRSLL